MRTGCWVLLVSVFVGCVKHNSLECNDGICSDAEFPFCDDDGSVAGTPNTCLAVSCTPGTFEECRGDELITCNTDGTNYDVTMCATGCDEAAMACNACTPGSVTCSDDHTLETCANDGTSTRETCDVGCVDGEHPHCAYLEPKYLPDACDTPAEDASLAFTSSGIFDTSLDNNCNGGIVAQAGAADICVVRYGTISLATGVVLNITGLRALALVADKTLTIDGTLDAGAKLAANGPGGGIITSGQVTEGAGFHINGGPTTRIVGSNGGPAQPNPATQAVLVGGTKSAALAGGGGAVVLAACRGLVTVNGIVTAGGGGGPGAKLFAINKLGPGGGAGSGGNIVMQALAVNVVGQVFANGGGGGGGMITGQTVGPDGQNGGMTDVVPTPGGMATTPASSGGAGAIVNTFAQGGGPGGSSGGVSGSDSGGGGSYGFIQTYTPMGVSVQLAPTHASPAFESNGTVSTR